ncbi:tryptophan--tRNA ligase [Anoxybacter fermentans]|uniref:Tryptophan--tRNA ligase n=1 Tax=Anoxybacter fermentans TaxID=1323375 RepID=A0A3Q9HNY0_9FIRM|nr:tryptophan--tRNA ligase [Anoxybacter fermentans]AZR72325.1 tryptophan--tRNA ligase [Anoxybacter fermentans]
MKKGRILSGSRPTGRQHLGHLKGILENWASLQDDYECIFEVADWHALTTKYNRTYELKDNIRETVIDWISAGIDPKKSIIFVQSDVKEHAELALLFSMIVSVGRLERNPTYKEQVQELNLGDSVSLGLLSYPVLQAADILIYKADTVPIGEDQLPHLELTREIARRFNYLYGKVKENGDGEEREEILPIPEPLLAKVPRLPGTDRRKMSKSYGNAIYLADSPDEILKKVKSMITDPQRVRLKDPGDPEVCTVYDYHKIFSHPELVEECSTKCREAGIGCAKCKQYLVEMLVEYLAPIQKKRKELEAQPEIIDEILENGKEKATKIARQTMEEIREAMHLKR